MQTLRVQSKAGEHMTIANVMENTGNCLPGSLSTSCIYKMIFKLHRGKNNYIVKGEPEPESGKYFLAAIPCNVGRSVSTSFKVYEMLKRRIKS